MPRIARLIVPNCPHHVTQRGNNRQDVFFTDDDRRAYLEFLREHCAAAGVRVLGYCLMTNHVHLLAVPPDEASLARALGRAHWRYTQYVNRLHGRCGHLWQNRFYSCPLDTPHTWAALAYMERNPVRARVVRRAWTYPWSSAAAHVGERPDDTGLLDLVAWVRDWPAKRWRAELIAPGDDTLADSLRRHLRTGRPLASDRWLARLETRLGRRLRPGPRGRPRKMEPSKGTGK
jgi:putative transposase